MSKTSNKNIEMVWVIGTFAHFVFGKCHNLSHVIQQRSAYGISKNMTTGQISSSEKIQHLAKANVPVVLPLIKGYVKGHEVFYITTEASEKAVADYLTNLTGSRVVYAPALNNAPADSLANIYEFKNGIKGTGPEGFQPNVADSQPGDPGYSPVWRINLVEWKQGITPRELKSEIDIIAAQDKGESVNKTCKCYSQLSICKVGWWLAERKGGQDIN